MSGRYPVQQTIFKTNNIANASGPDLDIETGTNTESEKEK